MKNYDFNPVTIGLNPFHENNDNTSIEFTVVDTDVYRDRKETIMTVVMDRDDPHDYRNNALTEFTLEEAQLRQLKDFLNKHIKD